MSRMYKNSWSVIALILGVLMSVSCATTDDYEGNANIENSNYENVAIAPGNNNQYVNNYDDNYNYNENGANLNNELYNEFANEGNNYNTNASDNYAMDNNASSIFNNNSSMYNQGMVDNGMGANETMVANTPMGEGINSVVDEFAASNVMEPIVEEASSEMMQAAPVDYSSLPTTGGIVKYVIENHVPIYDQPNGSVTGTLERGDHPLVWDEGAFSRTSQGKYIPGDKLSTKAIGRARKSPQWR